MRAILLTSAVQLATPIQRLSPLGTFLRVNQLRAQHSKLMEVSTWSQDVQDSMLVTAALLHVAMATSEVALTSRARAH
jgi:hypothetical protein